MNEIILKICSDRNFFLTGSTALKFQGVINRDNKDIDFVSVYDIKTIKEKIEKLFPDSKYAGQGKGDYEFVCYKVESENKVWLLELFSDRIIEAEYFRLENKFIKVIKQQRNFKIKRLFNKEKYTEDAKNFNEEFFNTLH